MKPEITIKTKLWERPIQEQQETMITALMIGAFLSLLSSIAIIMKNEYIAIISNLLITVISFLIVTSHRKYKREQIR